MAYKSRKSEHSGAKKGKGAYWGVKLDAKKEAKRLRRENNKSIIRNGEKDE